MPLDGQPTDNGPTSIRVMSRRLFLAILVWTFVVVYVVLFWPWSLPEPGCWQLVDAPAHCQVELAASNERVWWTQTVPMLAFLASGYIIIGALAARRRLRGRRRHGQPDEGAS